jgi:nitrous oxide reductase accessory protein NosL
MRHLPAIFAKRRAFKRLAAKTGKKLVSLKEVTQLVLDNIEQVPIKKLR